MLGRSEEHCHCPGTRAPARALGNRQGQDPRPRGVRYELLESRDFSHHLGHLGRWSSASGRCRVRAEVNLRRPDGAEHVGGEHFHKDRQLRESCSDYVRQNEAACEAKPECTWLAKCAGLNCAGIPRTYCREDETCDWDEETLLCTRIASLGPDACEGLGLGGSPSECSEARGCDGPRCANAEG